MPAITKPNLHFDATLWTGNGGTQSITNSGFQPDFVWYKGRSTTYNNATFDSTRGVLKSLYTNTTAAEGTSLGTLTAFNSNGFSVGDDAGVNTNAGTYVAWQWKAGGSTTVTNTSGTISSQVSANPTAGFSVVTYTANNTAGATIGHGLGVAPSFIIVKSRSAVNSWNSYHISLGNTKGIDLNSTDAASTSSNYWNNTSPTSSVFSVAAYTNNLTGTYVAYCFAPVAGYSAFGSYTGNGSTDGPFVYLGFRPRFVLFKSTGANVWSILDSVRDTYNVTNLSLQPNSTAAQETGKNIDFLSNGFKQRQTDGGWNGNGTTYIYAAFAETPFKFASAR